MGGVLRRLLLIEVLVPAVPSAVIGPIWCRFAALEQACLEANDKIVGVELTNLCVDGCAVTAPCGGQAAGRSPVDRGIVV